MPLRAQVSCQLSQFYVLPALPSQHANQDFRSRSVPTYIAGSGLQNLLKTLEDLGMVVPVCNSNTWK